MLKFTSIVGYTSCGPMYIECFLTIFGQCINVLNYNSFYMVCSVTYPDFPYASSIRYFPSKQKLEEKLSSRNVFLSDKNLFENNVIFTG